MEETPFAATRTDVDVNGKIKIRVCEPKILFTLGVNLMISGI